MICVVDFLDLGWEMLFFWEGCYDYRDFWEFNLLDFWE